jgi:hypothetical protein
VLAGLTQPIWSLALMMLIKNRGVTVVTDQNVISMLVLHHEHNGFAKIEFLGLFK